MTYYFYIENDQQFGPFTIEELKSMRLKKSTLIWREGMKTWIAAENVDEVKSIFIAEPPPFSKKKKKHPRILTIAFCRAFFMKKLQWVKLLGIALITIQTILFFTGLITFDTINNDDVVFDVVLLIALTSRIAAILIVVNIASRLSRNYVFWGISSMLLPSITLTIFGILLNPIEKFRNEES